MTDPCSKTRRQFLYTSAAAAGGVLGRSYPAGAAGPLESQRITLAQVYTTGEVSYNLSKARRAFDQAKKDGAGWILFPELFLTGVHNGDKFKQTDVAPAFEEIQGLCRELKIVGLIGTGWRENGKCYNAVQVVQRDGKVASTFAKTCLTRGDTHEFDPGPIHLMHSAGGIKFGILICNDLWVTPGFSDGPNPHLTWKMAKEGAQVIFHAIGSGNDQRFRAYHESNMMARAWEAKCQVVAVNGFRGEGAVNASSGVVGTEFRYESQLPRGREAIRTVEFTPADPKRQLLAAS